MNSLPAGTWPVMLTPFDENRNIDFNGLKDLIDFYLDNNVSGLFATCGSSEISMLSRPEIIELCKATVKQTNGRVPIVAGIPKCDTIAQQAELIKQISGEGVDCCVIMACYIASQDETEEQWISEVESLLEMTENIPLGIYECPHPYHRLLPPETLKWIAQTGRFLFHKDTCCNIKDINNKLEYCKDTNLSFYNAHTGSLLDSMKNGAKGYCGVGINFYPELYNWILDNYDSQPHLAEEIADFLSNAEGIFGSEYPPSSKVFLKMRGLEISPVCRVSETAVSDQMTQNLRLLLEKTNYYIQKADTQSCTPANIGA
ncbi:MAG: dihydrodipicolinate synthase family protein [Sedimentisphaeraceae bacterium JB056]